MRYAILMGRKQGSPCFEALGVAGRTRDVTIAFKALQREPGDLAELHLLVSDQGVTKRKKFGASARDEKQDSTEAAQEESELDNTGSDSSELAATAHEPAEAPGAEDGISAPEGGADDEGPTLGETRKPRNRRN